MAPGVELHGDITIGPDASVWFRAVLRAEMAPIGIGAGTNIQDGCILHTDPGFPVSIGANVTVGHAAVLHGCTIGDGALIGIGAIVLNGATVGDGAVVAAGALVPEGTSVAPRMVVMGTPAKPVREVNEGERNRANLGVEHYKKFARSYRD